MQFFFSPILGGLSDRFGRRPVVLLSNFGLALDYVLMALAPSLTWLFVGRVISGITSASVSTAFAYIADLTPAEQRAAVFGKIGVAFGAGFILGPAVGGLLGGMDPRLPFWVAAGLSFANTLYGLLILPESLPPDRRSPFHWRNANPLGALHLLRSDRVLTGLSVVNFLAQLAHVVLPSTFVLYATYRYGWDTTTVGLTLAIVGICSMAVQGAAIGPIVKRFGERRALLLGLGCGALGFLMYGAAPTGLLFWLGIPVMALWGVAGAALQALTKQRGAPDQQGQLQGAPCMIVCARSRLTSPSPTDAMSKSVSQISSAPSSGSPSARKNSAKRQRVTSMSNASLSWRRMLTSTSLPETSPKTLWMAAHLRRGLPSMPSPMAANNCFDQSRKACFTMASALSLPSSARNARSTGTRTWACMRVLSRRDTLGSTR